MTALYTSGTISLVNGSDVINGIGTAWKTSLIVGGTVHVEAEGNALPILPDDSAGASEHPITDTQMTAAIKWQGATGTYKYTLVRENTYTTAQAANADKIAELLLRLNHPTIAAIAGVQAQQDHLILLTGQSTATTIPRTSLIQGIEADATVETPAGLSTYESEAVGFIVLVSNAGNQRAALYFKKSAAAGDWSAPAFLTGSQGIQGDVGPRGITWRGVWDGVTAYAKYDVVQNNKSAWIALRANTNVTPPVLPTTANADWELFARAGVDGSGTGDMVGPTGGVSVNQMAGFADTTGKNLKGLSPEDVRIYAQVAKGGYAGRDILINGNRQRWLRAISQTSIGYMSRNRWGNNFSSSVVDTALGSFAPGQTDVPGSPQFHERTQWTPGADNAAAFAVIYQDIWDVRKVAGKRLTLTFWARASYARPLPIELRQSYGTGGSPSGPESTLAGTFNIGTVWQRFSSTFVMAPSTGKVFGTSNNSRTEFVIWLDAGTNYQSRNGGLARMPQGWIDIAQMSLVEGDATGEILPVSWYDPDIENRRMDAYQQVMVIYQRDYSRDGGSAHGYTVKWPEMRRPPDLQLMAAGNVFGIQDFQLYSIQTNGCRPEMICAGGPTDMGVLDRVYFLNAEG